MNTYEIPLTPQPQRFQIPLAGKEYQFRITYQDVQEGGWTLDISDAGGAPILHGVPLVTGADLLEQYAYLNIGGALYVQSDGDADAVPTFDNLGITSKLYFVVP